MSANDRYVKAAGSNADTGVDMDHAWATVAYAVANITAPGDIIVQNGDTFTGSAAVGAAKGSLVTIRPETPVAQYAVGYTLAMSDATPHYLLASSNIKWQNAKLQAGAAATLTFFCDNRALANLLFEDCTFAGTNTAGNRSILWNASGDVTLRRCTIQNAATAASSYRALDIQGIGGGLALTVEDCRFANQYQLDATCWGILTSVRWRRNTNNPSGIPGRGVRIGDYSKATNTITDVIVEGNTLDAEPAAAAPWSGVAIPLRTFDVNGLVIHDNSFLNGFDQLYLEGAVGADVSHNFFSMTRPGESIHILGARDLSFHDNDIWAMGGLTDYTSYGISLKPHGISGAKLGNVAIVRNAIHTRNRTGAYYIPYTLANLLETGKFLHVDRNVYDLEPAATGWRSYMFSDYLAADTLANIRAGWLAAGLPSYDGGANSDCDAHSVASCPPYDRRLRLRAGDFPEAWMFAHDKTGWGE